MKARHICFVFLMFTAVRTVCAQPLWEDVSPLPGHDVAFLTGMITPEGGLWAAICPLDTGVCYDDRHYRPFLTTDGGNTWEMRGTGIPVGIGTVRIEINPHNSNRLLASTVGFFCVPYVSTDRGLTWSASSEGLPHDSSHVQTDCDAGWFPDGEHAWCFERWHERGRRLYISSDSAVSWDSVWSGGSGNDVATVVTPPLVEGGLLWDGWPGTFASFDFGRTAEWRAISMPRTEFLYFSGTGQSVGVLYGVGGYFLHGTFDRFSYPIVSMDTARTWWFLNPADTLRWRSWNAHLLVDSAQDGHLLFAAIHSLFETWNDGQTWDSLLGDTSRYFFTVLGYDPAEDRVFVSGSYPEPVIGFERGIWRLDRGQSVDPPTAPVPSAPVVQLFPNPATAGGLINLIGSGQSLRALVMYNLLGQEVCRWSLPARSVQQAQNLVLPRSLSSGVYFLRIATEQQSLWHKIIVQR